MRNVVLLSILIAFITIISGYYEILYADPKGKCKTRIALNTPNWQDAKLSYRDCKKLNRIEDGNQENLHQEKGFVWWDKTAGSMQQMAQVGKCKTRDSVNDENWKAVNLNFKDCKALNRKTDGNQDNLHSKIGLVWWDNNEP